MALPALPQQPQQAPVPAVPKGVTRISTTTQLVVVDVTLKDKNGNPAKGLKPSDFIVTEDGKKQDVKICEYQDKFHHGITLATNKFFMFYFVLTMIHMAHVIIGTVVLIVLRQRLVQGEYDRDNMNVLEMAASYWHLADLLWIFLFPLLYLLR